MSSMLQKQVIGWKERHANVCARVSTEKPLKAKLLMGLSNCIEANENAEGFL